MWPNLMIYWLVHEYVTKFNDLLIGSWVCDPIIVWFLSVIGCMLWLYGGVRTFVLNAVVFVSTEWFKDIIIIKNVM